MDETATPPDADEQPAADRPPAIDRSVVMDEGLKNAARLSIRLLLVGLLAAGLIVVIGLLWAAVFPIVIAIILCTVLAGPTEAMRHRGVPGALASLISMAGFFLLLALVVAWIVPQLANQSRAMYLQIVSGVQQFLLWLQGPPLDIDTTDLEEVLNEAIAWLQDQAGTIATGVFTAVTNLTTLAITAFITVVVTFFFLKDGRRFLPWLRGMLGRSHGWHATELSMRGWNTVKGYIRAQAVVSLVDAVFIGLGLAIIGVPMASVLAVITFLAGFIPIVGALVAGALAVIIALFALGFVPALLTLVLVVAVQQIESNVLQPTLQSRAMHLHAVIVLVSVGVGGSLFGIVGAFLAVPAAATIAVVARYVRDVAMLRSGEATVDDIRFATRAGLAAGRRTEELGAKERAARTAAPVAEDIDSPDEVVDEPPEPHSFGERLAHALGVGGAH